MIYKWNYRTPDGFTNIFMHSDGEYLTGLWFEESRDAAKHETNCGETKLPIFEETCEWLDIYFDGKQPDFTPKYKINNLTQFRQEVIDIMNSIPFGGVLTYGDISKMLARRRKNKNMSSQAVGGAVG